MFSKKVLSYFLLLFIFSANAYSQIPTSGLVAWYPFCGNAIDKSGNSRDLVLSGPTPTTDRFGNAGNAYLFNGSTPLLTNIISRTPPLPTDTTDFTYAAWFNLDTTGTYLIAGNGDINIDGYGLITQGHDVAIYFGGVGIYLPTYVTFHQWHQAILRRTGTTFSLFLDTVIIGSFNGSFLLTSPSQSFAVGQDYTNGSKSFPGKIDDIAVYNRPLTDPEISHLFHYNPDVFSTLGNDTSVCLGFSLPLFPSPQYPGLNYLWSTGSTDTSVTATSLGTYWFEISKPYGCTTSDTMHITLGTVAVSIGNDTSVCIGDTFMIVSAAPAGSSYLWSTGDTTSTISVAAPGTYWLNISNSGCPGADTMNFGYSPVPLVNIGRDTTLCSGLPLTLQSSFTYPSASYSWNTGVVTPSISPMATGNYILGVLVNGCSGYDTVHVTFKPTPVVAFGPNVSLCVGDSVVLSATGSAGTTFNWSTGDTANALTIDTSGIFWLTANTNGCIATDTITVTVNAIPVVHLGPDLSRCMGTNVILQSSDAYSGVSYVWNTGAGTPTLDVNMPGTYALTVTKNGCSGVDSINVTFLPVPVVNLGSDASFCSGTSFPLSTAQPAGSTYLWSTGSTAASINVTTPGLYGVIVTNNGCVGTDSIVLTTIKAPTINLGRDTALCDGYSMQLYIDGDQASYLWSDGSTGNSYTVNQNGQVWAAISNFCGTATDSIYVHYGFCNIWFPTAFSPNGDGKNDIIKVRGSLGAYQEYTFTVFNRWGVVMFTTSDINKGWDGMYNNEEQGIGTYFYMMTYKLNNQTYSMKGDFELVR